MTQRTSTAAAAAVQILMQILTVNQALMTAQMRSLGLSASQAFMQQLLQPSVSWVVL